jgi:outer membrane lipoprotein SlyB
MFKQSALAATVAAAASLAGCVVAPPNTVSAYDAQRMSTVVDATVLSVRPVTIQGRDSGIGTVSGAVIGGIAGSNVGGPRTGGIVGIAGAVVGGLVGNAVEKNASQANGVEILLQLKNGERRSVVQAAGPEVFAAGEPVIMVTTGGRTRVQPAPPVTTGSTTGTVYPAAYPAPAQ